MRLEKRGAIIYDDAESDAIIFDSREELQKELHLLDQEVEDFPEGPFYFYADGRLYHGDSEMLWDEADQRTWVTPKFWKKLWEKAQASE